MGAVLWVQILYLSHYMMPSLSYVSSDFWNSVTISYSSSCPRSSMMLATWWVLSTCWVSPRTKLVGSKTPDLLLVKFIRTWSYASDRVWSSLIPSSLCPALPEPSLLTYTPACLLPCLPQAQPLSRMPFLLFSISSNIGVQIQFCLLQATHP